MNFIHSQNLTLLEDACGTYRPKWCFCGPPCQINLLKLHWNFKNRVSTKCNLMVYTCLFANTKLAVALYKKEFTVKKE